ncbi:MAG: Hsp33 family molecular chaperone HslO [Clostridiales bacterium]|nr:Hsp33 family molecular chaperone HslO [Clostridiales bacterium]
MTDKIIRATAAQEHIRAFAVDSTEMVSEAREIHKTYPVVTAALGRLLSAGAMMGSMMKGEEDLITLTIKGDGPIGSLTVTADSHGNVKGFPGNPSVDIPTRGETKLDVGGAIGSGILTVSMDLGLKEPYNGQVELQTGEIGEDLAYYFTVSEQTPSAVALGVKVGTDSSVMYSGGFIIQLMPDAPEEVIAALESKLAKLEPVTTLMERGLGPADILALILDDLDLVITEEKPVRFHCNCSRERISHALATLSTDDLESLIADEEEIEIKCFFCNSAYKFGIDELKEILTQRNK